MTITSSVFETYYTLVNVNSINNKFYYDNEKIVISEESYELRDIERYLKHEFFFSRREGERVLAGDLRQQQYDEKRNASIG